jgi:hypothetical protein
MHSAYILCTSVTSVASQCITSMTSCFVLTILVIVGSMTDINVIVSIEDSIKRTRECVEDYGFFHNVISKCLLVQVIVIPFISTHRGLPLQSNCLQPHELEKLAEILPELNTELSEMLGEKCVLQSVIVAECLVIVVCLPSFTIISLD